MRQELEKITVDEEGLNLFVMPGNKINNATVDDFLDHAMTKEPDIIEIAISSSGIREYAMARVLLYSSQELKIISDKNLYDKAIRYFPGMIEGNHETGYYFNSKTSKR